MTTLDAAITTVCSASTLTYVTEPELDAVITMVDGLKSNICAAMVPYTGSMTIAQTNAFWSKLCGSLSVPGLQPKMLHIMSVVSYDSVNTPMVLGCLQAIGEQLEAYLASCTSKLEDKDSKEWNMFRDVLCIFYRAMDYDLSAGQVLEFVDKNPALAVGVLDATLRMTKTPIADKMSQSNWQTDVALAVCISKNLYELSLHATYFEGTDEAKSAGTAAAAHHDEFQKFIGDVVQGIVSSGVMETSVFLLSDWLACIREQRVPHALELLPWLEVFISNILSFIANVISKTDESAAVLRKHVASETTLVQSAVIPYMIFALDLMERQGNSPAGSATLGRSVKTILLLLKLLAFMTHKVKLFRPHVKSYPTLVQRILTQPLLWSSPYQIEFISLCTRLCVNAELEDGTKFMEHVAATSLTQDMRAKIAWRLTGAADEMYPVNTLSDMYPRLESLFDESIAQADTGSQHADGAYAVSGAVKGEVAY